MARTTVEAQLAKLRKAKAELEKKEKALLNRTQGKIMAKIVQLAADNGISAAQIAEALKAEKPAKAKRAAKRLQVRVARWHRNIATRRMPNKPGRVAARRLCGSRNCKSPARSILR